MKEELTIEEHNYLECSCGCDEFIRIQGLDIVKIQQLDTFNNDELIDELIDPIYFYRCIKCGNEVY